MIGRLLAALAVFRKGREFVHAGRWKNAAFASEAAALVVGVSVVAQMFGWIDAPISEDAALKIAVGVYAAAGVLSGLVHIGSSAKVGFGGADHSEEAGDHAAIDPPPFPCPDPWQGERLRAPPADYVADSDRTDRRVLNQRGRLSDTTSADHELGGNPGDDVSIDNLPGRFP